MEALLQASWPQGAYSASWCQDKVELDIWHVQYGLGVPWGVQPHHGHEGHQSLRLWTWGEWLGTCKRTAGHSAGTCVRSLTLLCKADFKFSDFQGCNRILLSLRRMNANCHWSSPPWMKLTRILLPALPATNTPHPLLQPSLSGSVPWIGTTARQIFWKHIALQWGVHFNLYHIYSYQSVSPWPSIQTRVYVRGHLASNLDWHCQRTCLQEFWGTIQRRAA